MSAPPTAPARPEDGRAPHVAPRTGRRFTLQNVGGVAFATALLVAVVGVQQLTAGSPDDATGSSPAAAPTAARVLDAVAAQAPGGFVAYLAATHSGQCWAVDATGAVVEQECDRSAGQRIAFVPDGGRYQLRMATGCVTASGPASRDGVSLTVGGCPGLPVDLEAVSGRPGDYRVVAAPGRCLEVLGGRSEAGAPLGVWSCGDVAVAGHQLFRLTQSERADAAQAGTSGGAGAAAAGASGGAQGAPAVSTGGWPRPVATRVVRPKPAPAKRWTPAAVKAAGLAGTAPQWGKASPPKGAVRSRAYALAVANVPKGYQPRAGECSAAVHGRYWMWGLDGKVYPTWHPRRGPGGCTFGHEHGDDPRTSRMFAAVGWPAFGYTNEQLAPSNPASQRNEDHVGHKVTVLNQVATHPGNDVNRPASQVCDAYLKFHQGTHSPDALASNLHELFYNARCRHTADGSVTEAHVQVLLPIGVPGSFNSTNTCDGSGNTVHAHVADPAPLNSIEGGGLRKLPDADCAAQVLAGNGDISRFTELWTLELHTGTQGPLKRLDLNPYAHVNNPARYYDPTSPSKIGYTIDLCYRGAKGADCDRVRAITARTGQKVAFDDPRSPFNGARRRLNPNYFVVVNSGPSVMWSDVFGRHWSTTPFPGAIKQYVRGTYDDRGDQGDMFVGGDVGPHEVNYAANPADKVRAPN